MSIPLQDGSLFFECIIHSRDTIGFKAFCLSIIWLSYVWSLCFFALFYFLFHRHSINRASNVFVRWRWTTTRISIFPMFVRYTSIFFLLMSVFNDGFSLDLFPQRSFVFVKEFLISSKWREQRILHFSKLILREVYTCTQKYCSKTIGFYPTSWI